MQDCLRRWTVKARGHGVPPVLGQRRMIKAKGQNLKQLRKGQKLIPIVSCPAPPPP